jgi:ubiquinone/menaquinone biosynthesis C-methylase UbiE
MDNDSRVILEAWNGVLFQKFLRFRSILTDGLRGHSDRGFRRRPPREGDCVLDIGCGFGDTTLELAQRVGERGSATGVDCAENFVLEARAGARSAGRANVAYRVADAQLEPLGGPYDHAYSRFGTMFFTSPGAALRNVRRALKPAGSLTMVVWRRREDNAWLHAAELCVREVVPVVSHESTDQVHCGPGPFSMAGADLVSDVLQSAGYVEITFERCDLDICIGRDLDEAVAFTVALGPAGEIIRLAGEEGEQRLPLVDAALRRTLGEFVRDDGVWAPSSTWLVFATNPA